MKGIKVEIDLAELIVGTKWGPPDSDGDPTEEPLDLLGAVFNDVARQLLAELRNRATGSDIYGGLRQRIDAIRDEEIREAVRPAITEALTKAVQPTNHYGEAQGEPKTLHETIVEKATAWLTTAKGDYYAKDKRTPIQAYIEDEVQKAFTKELRAEMEKAKAQVVKAVQDEGARVLAETIARMAKVA